MAAAKMSVALIKHAENHVSESLRGMVHSVESLAKIELLRHNAEGDPTLLTSWNVRDSRELDQDTIRSEAILWAQEDANTAKAACRYILRGYNSDGELQRSSPPFRVQPSDTELGPVSVLMNDGPIAPVKSNSDVVREVMGLVQGLVRTTVQTAANATETLRLENVRLAKDNEKMRERHDEIIIEREKLLNMSVEREIAREEAKRSDERKEKLLDESLPLFKAIGLQMAKKAGVRLTSGDIAASPVLGAMKTFLDSLSDEQMRMILGSLSPAQQAGLGTLYEAMAMANVAAKGDK